VVGNIRESLRAGLIKRRERLDPIEVGQLSDKICRRMMLLDEYRYAKHIALYHAVRGEIVLDRIWRAAPMHGKYCYFPICFGDELKFVPATPANEFVANKYGILEPKVDISKAIEPNALDLVLTPLVAFDPFGVRIGMGKGYYDKAFSKLSSDGPVLMGVAYQFQKQSFLPLQSWDVLLHGTLTESNLYWTNRVT
jgi:5-formyltetrahydrofolate cyclo-ligase